MYLLCDDCNASDEDDEVADYLPPLRPLWIIAFMFAVVIYTVRACLFAANAEGSDCAIAGGFTIIYALAGVVLPVWSTRVGASAPMKEILVHNMEYWHMDSGMLGWLCTSPIVGPCCKVLALVAPFHAALDLLISYHDQARLYDTSESHLKAFLAVCSSCGLAGMWVVGSGLVDEVALEASSIAVKGLLSEIKLEVTRMHREDWDDSQPRLTFRRTSTPFPFRTHIRNHAAADETGGDEVLLAEMDKDPNAFFVKVKATKQIGKVMRYDPDDGEQTWKLQLNGCIGWFKADAIEAHCFKADAAEELSLRKWAEICQQHYGLHTNLVKLWGLNCAGFLWAARMTMLFGYSFGMFAYGMRVHDRIERYTLLGIGLLLAIAGIILLVRLAHVTNMCIGRNPKSECIPAAARSMMESTAIYLEQKKLQAALNYLECSPIGIQLCGVLLTYPLVVGFAVKMLVYIPLILSVVGELLHPQHH